MLTSDWKNGMCNTSYIDVLFSTILFSCYVGFKQLRVATILKQVHGSQ